MKAPFDAVWLLEMVLCTALAVGSLYWLWDAWATRRAVTAAGIGNGRLALATGMRWDKVALLVAVAGLFVLALVHQPYPRMNRSYREFGERVLVVVVAGALLAREARAALTIRRVVEGGIQGE